MHLNPGNSDNEEPADVVEVPGFFAMFPGSGWFRQSGVCWKSDLSDEEVLERLLVQLPRYDFRIVYRCAHHRYRLAHFLCTPGAP